MADWMLVRDEGGRMTYPPRPTQGGNPNATAPTGMIEGVVVALQRTQGQEAEFRARQYARRLQTRGRAAMSGSEPPSEPPEPLGELPDDPVAQAMHAAGWL